MVFLVIVGGVMMVIVVYLLLVKLGMVGCYWLVLIGIGVGLVLMVFNGLLLVKGSLDSVIIVNLWLLGLLYV